jgi:conjugative transfer region lipoprotein (TIGR03751 family)
MKFQLTVILLGALTSLAACAGSKDAVLPPNGQNIKAIYESHMGSIGINERTMARESLDGRVLMTGDRDLQGYTRDAYNELDTHFPRLPNPTLVLYVFPHLVGEERVPVPGYATTFPLFRTVEYALPGELDGSTLRLPAD